MDQSDWLNMAGCPGEVAELLCDTAQDLATTAAMISMVPAWSTRGRNAVHDGQGLFWVSGYDGNPVSSGYYGRRDRSFYVEDAQPGDTCWLAGWTWMATVADTGDFAVRSGEASR